MKLSKNQLEFLKCYQDIKYFAEKYVKVWVKEKKKFVPFVLLPHQHQVIEAFINHDQVIISKYRQGGITTLFQLYATWCIVFKDNIKIDVVANKLNLAMTDIFEGIVRMVSELPIEIFNRVPEEGNDTKSVKVYNNGVRLRALAAGKDGIRGGSPDILFLDEIAFFEHGPEFWTSAGATMATGGQVILCSTPNGQDSVYYETYQKAKNKENDFFLVEIFWYQDDRYNVDLKWVKDDDIIETKEPDVYLDLIKKGYKPYSSWFKKMCALYNNDSKKIAQELQNSFLGSGGTLISGEDIAKIESDVMEPIRKLDNEKTYIYEEPKEGEEYLMGIDVSDGISGDDNSSIEIYRLDITDVTPKYIQVLEYNDKIEPDMLGIIALKYIKEYFNPYVVVDTNGSWGVGTIKTIMAPSTHYELGYKNVYMEETNDKVITSELKKFMKNNKVPGFRVTNEKVRTLILNEFESMIRFGMLIIRSKRLLNEIKKFIYNTSTRRYDHSRTSHDDLIMATAYIIYVYTRQRSKLNDKDRFLQLANLIKSSPSDSLTYETQKYYEEMNKDISNDDILEKVKEFGRKNVQTGFEPFYQNDITIINPYIYSR